MARISVWFVRASLVHFVVGATAGAWRLAGTNGALPLPPLPLHPLHVEGMLLGWVCQLALGVALWILPFSRNVSADRRLWIAWAALNSGVAGVTMARLASRPSWWRAEGPRSSPACSGPGSCGPASVRCPAPPAIDHQKPSRVPHGSTIKKLLFGVFKME